MGILDARLGRLSAKRLAGYLLYVSPDVCAWIAPTTVTLFLAVATLYEAGYIAVERYFGLELLVFLTVVGSALTFSLLCGLTDPGVVPRPVPGSPDPNEGDSSLRWCEACKIRRPLRAHHCYVCNVCVLEHDHHCGVIGGCVGQRSLRYFTGYLLCIGVATLHGLSFLLRSLMRMNNGSLFGAQHTRRLGRGPRPPPPSASPGGTLPPEPHGVNVAIHILLVIFVGNIALVVGGLGLYYLYLALSDTTRREAQGKGRAQLPSGMSAAEMVAVQRHETRASELRSRWAWRRLGRLGRVLFPPPSLLDEVLAPSRSHAAPRTDSVWRDVHHEEDPDRERLVGQQNRVTSV